MKDESKQSVSSDIKDRAVNLTWTWYLFLLANIILIIGIALGWGIYVNSFIAGSVYIPIIICNVIGVFSMGLFYFIDAREIYLVRQHIPQKYFRLYFAAGFIFIINLIVISTYVALIDKIQSSFDISDLKTRISVTFAILFAVSAFISLVVIGVYRYAKYRIDLILYLRRRGEVTIDKIPDTTDDGKQATSDLTNHAD